MQLKMYAIDFAKASADLLDRAEVASSTQEPRYHPCMFVYRFRPEQEIDPDDPENAFDCKAADAFVRKLILRAEMAVRKSSLPEFEKGFFGAVLPLFRQTHDSIRVLCKELYEAHGHTGDALSLVREQIEKLFALQLVCEDPNKWVPLYLKDGWRKAYEMFLHAQAEVADLPRFQEFITKHGPHCMEQLRLGYGVTDDEKKVVELKADGQPVPPSLKQYALEEFPTPGKALSKLTDGNRKEFMKRWYVEYKRYCSFSHVLTPKVVLNQLQTHGVGVDPRRRTDFLNKYIEPALILSYLAIGSAVAEINRVIGQNHEVLESLSELWETLRRGSLLGVAFWDMRVKDLLPQLIGATP